jgi:hypothetical protein
MFRQRHVQEVDDFLRNYVVTRQREGALRDVDPDLAVRSILGMAFFHSLETNLFRCRTTPVSDEEAVDTFIRIALDGLRRPAAAEAPEEHR